MFDKHKSGNFTGSKDYGDGWKKIKNMLIYFCKYKLMSVW